MSLKRTTGIIIKVTDYGESDKIVTLYCPVEGRLTVIAKGAKRSKKRFMNKLELFTHLDILYNNRYTLAIIDQAELKNSFTNLSINFKRYAAAGLICELLMHWTHENDGDNNLFFILTHTLSLLNNSHPVKKTIVLFLIHFYARIGYQPNLLTCIKCGNLPSTGTFQFKVNIGAIICHNCSATHPMSIPLALPTLKLISQAQKMPFEKTIRLQFPPQAIRESLHLFKQYGSYLLDREINAWAFLEKG